MLYFAIFCPWTVASDQQRSQEKLVPCQRAALYHVRTNASASHEAGFQGCMYLASIEEWKEGPLKKMHWRWLNRVEACWVFEVYINLWRVLKLFSCLVMLSDSGNGWQWLVYQSIVQCNSHIPKQSHRGIQGRLLGYTGHRSRGAFYRLPCQHCGSDLKSWATLIENCKPVPWPSSGTVFSELWLLNWIKLTILYHFTRISGCIVARCYVVTPS